VTTTATLPRCPHKGCPIRYRGGPDRPCREHRPDNTAWSGRLAELTQTMAAPGDHDGDGR